MSGRLTREVADPIRMTFIDTGPEVALLVSMVMTTIHPAASSTARCDPLYVDRLNAWWADAGKRLGFRWTTVADLSFRDENGIEVDAVWGRLSNARRVMFTAEPESAVIANYAVDLALLREELDTARALIAESAPVVAFVQRLANGNIEVSDGGSVMIDGLRMVELREAARGTFEAEDAYVSHERKLMAAATALLVECAQRFRFYETQHREKVRGFEAELRDGPIRQRRIDELDALIIDTEAKAERNAEIAARIEALLLTGDMPADPRTYTAEQEHAAMEIFWAALKRVEDGQFLPWAAGISDLTKIAAALGMRRVGGADIIDPPGLTTPTI